MQPISTCLATFDPSHLPPLVPRSRLLDALRSQPATGPLFIQGQAAQGKTCLAASFLNAQKAPVVWITPPAACDLPMDFIDRLEKALAHGWPSPIPIGSFTPQETPPICWQERLAQICARLPEGLEIVLDGLDRWPNKAAVQGPLDELCRRSEGHFRVWLLSRRSDTFTMLRKWVGAGRGILDNTDLAFTPDETALYVRTLHGMTPTPAWIDRLHRITDGWAGGLKLASQALQHHRQDGPEAFFDSLLNHLADEAAPFFSVEIFDQLSDRDRRLLFRAALLDDIDPALLGRIPDAADCPQMLQYLSENVGFLRSFSDGTDALVHYRLAPLFRDFLHHRMAIDLTSEQQKALFCDIGQAYDEQGQLRAAIPWYLKSGDLPVASSAIKGAGIGMVIDGRLEPLEAWLTQLPADHVRSDPWLFLFLTVARRLKGQAKCVADYQRAWEAFQATDEIRGAMLTTAFSIEALVFQGRSPDEILTWIRRGEALLAIQGEVPYFAWAKLLLWLQIAFGYIAGGLNLSMGMSAGRNALMLSGKMGNEGLIRQANIIYSLGLIEEGRFEQARERLAAVATAPDTLTALTYDILKRLAEAEMDRRQADPSGAETHLVAADKAIETHGLIFLYPCCVEAAGFIQVARKAYTQARLTARHFMDVSVLAGSAHFKALAHRLNALVDYHSETYAQSAAEAERALRIMDRQQTATLPAARTRQLRAMAAFHLGDPASALDLLNRAKTYYETTGNLPALAETHLMLGLVHHRWGELSAARTHLDRGLDLAAEGGFPPFVVLNPVDRDEISRIADGRHPNIDIGDASTATVESGAAIQNDASVIPAAGAATQPQHPSGWLEVRTFGGFAVLRDGRTPISDRQWGGNRPKMLFKALLVHGLREIPRDIIIDNLWPDRPPQSALQNLKVTLHRLRKVLEPDLDSHRSSAFVHLKDNLISLDRSRCRVDLEDFLICCKEIKRYRTEGKLDAIPALGRQLMALYQGDFMPEEPYAPWMEMKRWALKDTYFETVLTVSAVLYGQGRLDAAVDCCRAAIQIDPFDERVVRELIMLYTHQGRHKDARDVFEKFRSAFKQELGLEPEGDIFTQVQNASVHK